MATATMTQVQQCITCTKIRVLNEHNIWSHWQPFDRVDIEVRRAADKVVCEYCQTSKERR